MALTARLQAKRHSPLAGLNFASLGRLARVQSVAPPGESRLGLLNMLSPWSFSKPLWQDNWQCWLTMSDPERLPALVVTHYGAGRTVVSGVRLTVTSLLRWKDYGRMCRRVLQWMAPRIKIRVSVRPRVLVQGLTGPAWWSAPLAAGLRGMGQRRTLAGLLLPPEALEEAGYHASTKTVAPCEILLGPAAQDRAAPGARLILRAPDLTASTQEQTFDWHKVRTLSQLRRVQQLSVGGVWRDVTLPDLVKPTAEALPHLILPVGRPAVSLPQAWRMRFTKDSDSREGREHGWFKPGYNTQSWPQGKLGRQTTQLFGASTGYDGAIWYRGWIKVGAASQTANAALVLQAQDDSMRIYIDGQDVAVAPQTVVLPLRKIGPGRHLLVVRTYGNLRHNYGLINIQARFLPLLWRADPKMRGWEKGWMQPKVDTRNWKPVARNFGTQASTRQGWVRFAVDVPAHAAPYEMVIHSALNLTSHVFVNGRLVGAYGLERAGRYVLPAAAFRSGRNVVVLWAHWFDAQAKSIQPQIVPLGQLEYRATIKAKRNGESLLAKLNYPNQTFYYQPAAVSMTVNGLAVGGWLCNRGSQPMLLAAHVLRAGKNDVSIRMTRSAHGTCGLASLSAVQIPADMQTPLAGWEELPGNLASAGWYLPGAAGGHWKPVGRTDLQSRKKIWEVHPTLNLKCQRYVYRTFLRLTAGDLKRIWTLDLDGPVIKRLLVNGQVITPVEGRYYPLNAALHRGLNEIACAPDESTWRGLNIRVPFGYGGGVHIPVLRHDVAPLIPVVPALQTYQLNHVFSVGRWKPPVDSRTLLAWPNGAPAVVMYRTGRLMEILAAPGIFDQVLPGPDLASRAMQDGGTPVIEYEYGQQIYRDLFRGDRIEQLLPALLDLGRRRPAYIQSLQARGHAVLVTIRSGSRNTSGQLAWRWLDWEGQYLQSGEKAVSIGVGGNKIVSIPMPNRAKMPTGSRLGLFYHLRLGLLSAHKRKIYSYVSRVIAPNLAVAVAIRTGSDLHALDAATAPFAKRILNESIDQLVQRSIYLPGQTVTLHLFATSNRPRKTPVSVEVKAVGGLTGQTVERDFQWTLSPWAQKRIRIHLGPDCTRVQQPWRVAVTASAGAKVLSRDGLSFVVAMPQGQVRDRMVAECQGRGAGGYMWSMPPNAHALEHIYGTDALPAKGGGPWWTRVRYGGDGNWLIAEGIHRGAGNGDQTGLLWGPFYEQYRGEIMDSYGWFPNGESIRQWWAPYGVRQIARLWGRKSVVFAMSDWWQYDAGYPEDSYTTMQMFNAWLEAHKGQVIAGQRLDGQPVIRPTLSGMIRAVQKQYPNVYRYFVVQGLADDAAYTNAKLDAVAPGTIQSGQAAYADWLPDTVGGAALAGKWAAALAINIVDADNHPFAGDWQYALETESLRALGPSGSLDNSWERPQLYHAVRQAVVNNLPLDPAEWQRRQLDSRWQVIANAKGDFKRVLNLTCDEYMASPHGGLLPRYPGAHIGHGALPDHWRINNRLDRLEMTIGVKQPLSPLLVVGDNGLNWVRYYRMLGKLRSAGLPLGGAVSIANLNALDPRQVPGLVWLAGQTVDAASLKAVMRLVSKGVPLLLVGQVPQKAGRINLRQWLGVFYVATPPHGPLQQRFYPTAGVRGRDLADMAGAGGFMPPSHYILSKSGPLKPVVTRQGRLVVGVYHKGPMKLVFATPVGRRVSQSDPAVLRAAVQAYEALRNPTVQWPGTATGYAFKGYDGYTYIVVQNLRSRSSNVHLRVHEASNVKWHAADLLTGARITVTTKHHALVLQVHLTAVGATVVVLAKAK